MIDYIAESRAVATVKIDGNMARILGIALAKWHRDISERIRSGESYEKGSEMEAESRYMLALLREEVRHAGQWQTELERLMAVIRQELTTEEV